MLICEALAKCQNIWFIYTTLPVPVICYFMLKRNVKWHHECGQGCRWDVKPTSLCRTLVPKIQHGCFCKMVPAGFDFHRREKVKTVGPLV